MTNFTVSNQKQNEMNKKQIIAILEAEQQDLWNALQNAETVFGIEHEATKMARARWVTMGDAITLIENSNAKI